MSKIIKTSLEQVVETAKKAGKYNDESVSEVKVTRLGLNTLSKGSDIEDEMVDTETGEVIKVEQTDTIPGGLSEEDTDNDQGDSENSGGKYDSSSEEPTGADDMTNEEVS